MTQQANVLAPNPMARLQSLIPHDRKKEPIPANTPLTSMCALRYAHMHKRMHTCEHTHIHVH